MTTPACTCTYCGAPATVAADPGYYGKERATDYRCDPCSGDLSAVVLINEVTR